MVAQPVYYFRFDPITWTNTDTGNVETYFDFVASYDITQFITNYSGLDDVDYTSDQITLDVQKSFFLNPTNNPAYANGGTDEINAFVPTNNHVVVVGPLADVESSNSYYSDAIVGIVQSTQDLNSNLTEIVCYSFIKNLAGQAVSSDYDYNRNTSNIDYTPTQTGQNYPKQNNVVWPSDDRPNRPQLFYPEIQFQKLADQPTAFWNRQVSSDPGFPGADPNADEFYPYAIYSLYGTATANGSITISFRDANSESGNPLVYNIPFYTGESADFIMSLFSTINLNINAGMNTYLRLTVVDNSIIVESLSSVAGTALTDVSLTCTPIQLSSSSIGLTSDYYYQGITGASTTPADGQVVILPLVESSGFPSSERTYSVGSTTYQGLPFSPLEAHGFLPVAVSGTIKNIEFYNEGYPLTKIAWRLLQSIGWCRQPFYVAMNPFAQDYDTNLNPVTYTSYQTDGLNMEFSQVDYGDGNTNYSVPYVAAFDPSQQSIGYNLKTLSDDQGMFIDAGFAPIIENHIPVWDTSVYNRPSYSTYEFWGTVNNSVTTINIYFPMYSNGQIVEMVATVPTINRRSPKQVAALVEGALLAVDGITDYYNIVRVGNVLYMETYDLGIATQMRNQSSTYYFQVYISQSNQQTPSLKVYQKYSVAYINAADRLLERVYYLRTWGIFPGFHPVVNIRLSPNLYINPPPVDYSFEYGGKNMRTNVTNEIVISSSPAWTTDSKDIVNKAVVAFTVSDSDTTTMSIVTFPADEVQYRYLNVGLTGTATVENNLNITLAIQDGTVTRTNTVIQVPIAVGETDVEVLAALNRTYLNIGTTVIQPSPVTFAMSTNGNTLMIMTNQQTAPLITNVTQLTVNLTNSDPGFMLTKELVADEPPEFALARDSQATNGVFQLSFTLPEMVSINDTVAFVANMFTKYMNPKNRCTCQMTELDNWYIPLFSYVNLLDFTNFTTTTDSVPWSAMAVFTTASTANQNVTLVFSYTDTSYFRVNVPILLGDSPATIVSKIIAANNVGELQNYILTSPNNNGVINFYPILTYTRTLKSLTILGSASNIFCKVSTYPASTVQITSPMNMDLVLTRVQFSSKSGTYTATFGQPMEDSTNLQNQLNTWVGDVEKYLTPL